MRGSEKSLSLEGADVRTPSRSAWFRPLLLVATLCATGPASAGSLGWAVGLRGTIVHTSDGGTTWSPQTSGITANRLNSVSFVDAHNGWVVGDFGTVLHTSDGGTTWSPQTSGFCCNFYGVSFVDTNNGWAAGEIVIIENTSNGHPVVNPNHRLLCGFFRCGLRGRQ